MFGSDKNKPAAKSTKPSSEVQTLIGENTTIRGDISFSGGLHVNGTVHGAVAAEDDSHDALLVLTDKGTIEGEVHAPHVVINGVLHGDVVATQKIELAASARIHGNIYYRLMEMAVGAQVNGKMIFEEEPARQLSALAADAPPVEDEVDSR